ncbi:hypothetical protein GLOTRDRAFT_79912 [Gloeophyllum trabeum ATCC 11539]|uniref:HIT-type domain-containing protein n=1 Tax=Gloeophyllum trabeum (strain ATCC 11539 / FP-39264 / Madison 617) TaxID=670483 RepID=S7PZM7_GLOTA|nr:uncharacterized protein GLOTRDRAFT_79912 [Gloeophyllum trabeum ATCC 11539]EPQ52752.1 hypothetical protein GLOTRDRAFT_79912 [Gloeophyllum trabeum ATCC 11539]
MPPKRGRPRRQVQSTAANAQVWIDPDVLAKRTKKHLEELERSNYTEPSATLTGADDEEPERGSSVRGRARQTISDKREHGRKKKSTMNVRTALLYRKNLTTLIEESGISSLPANCPTYLTAVVPPPNEPPRLICSVCGYWGKYKCVRCAMPYCDLNCEAVHKETRCERRVI